MESTTAFKASGQRISPYNKRERECEYDPFVAHRTKRGRGVASESPRTSETSRPLCCEGRTLVRTDESLMALHQHRTGHYQSQDRKLLPTLVAGGLEQWMRS